MKLTRNIHQTLLVTCLEVEGQRSRSQQSTLVRRSFSSSRMCLAGADVIKKAVEKAASSRHSTAQLRFDNPLVSSTCDACSVYLAAMETLTQLRLDIVAGIQSLLQSVLLYTETFFYTLKFVDFWSFLGFR